MPRPGIAFPTTLVPAAAVAALLLVGPAAIAAAQTTPGAVPAQDAAGTAVAEPSTAPLQSPDERLSADDLRRRFDDVLRQYPPTLREVLRNDPSLLANQDYLSSYPALASFVRSYPQVGRNVRFFVGDANLDRPSDPHSRSVDMWNRTIESLSIFSVMLLVVGTVAWLLRTALEHRRWLRSSKIQVDAHQKLFDRLASNDDLLTYVQTPAGQRFLEASPVIIDATPSPRAVSAPINRILWSVQIGIVLIPLGLGLQWVAGRVVEEAAQLLWFFGVLTVTIGIGFVGSAGVAYLISRRLGLIRDTAESAAPRSPATLS